MNTMDKVETLEASFINFPKYKSYLKVEIKISSSKVPRLRQNKTPLPILKKSLHIKLKWLA